MTKNPALVLIDAYYNEHQLHMFKADVIFFNEFIRRMCSSHNVPLRCTPSMEYIGRELYNYYFPFDDDEFLKMYVFCKKISCHNYKRGGFFQGIFSDLEVVEEFFKKRGLDVVNVIAETIIDSTTSIAFVDKYNSFKDAKKKLPIC